MRPELADLVDPGQTAIVAQECQGAVIGPDAGLAMLAEEARRVAKGRPDSYAIIPYDGPNQTRRRPIYIECSADAVILQPEGIVFDHSGSMALDSGSGLF